MIETTNSIGTITLQASSDPELKALLKTLIDRQEKANALLEKIAVRTEEKEMLSHKEAAALLGVHVSTLQIRMEKGEIPVYRVGSKKLYKRSDLEAWLELQAAKKVIVHSPDE